MIQKNILPCYVGISSLEEIASPDNRVLVMNILGNESRKVTPVSHEYSGGNVVAGVQYGRPGKMKTPIGDIPVYSRLADAIEKHTFDTGVIYLPPTAVTYAVMELAHYNKNLKKIIIVTEKLSTKDQRIIRTIAQSNKIDVFGANSLGVADAWNHTRIGGGLGGDRPGELLIKGTVAIHSNSGNFSTTMTEYLKTEGFGVTTVVSSGKDKIIQFAVPEFLITAQNDPRTKAVVLYIEPGGFYEKMGLDLIQKGQLKFDKPIIALVTGRWKANLSRAVGHAGALAGSGDGALAKEEIFDGYFGQGAFDPEHPEQVSEKGVRITSLQHIALAMKAVYDKKGWQPDFAPKGDLSLKPWFANDMDWDLPQHLRIPVVEALYPYNEEIALSNKQLGAVYLRRNMRNASGASGMDAQTRIGSLHGQPVTELSNNLFEHNLFFALSKTAPTAQQAALFNVVLNYLSAVDDFYFSIVEKAEKNNATPNEALIAALALMGDKEEFTHARIFTEAMIKLYAEINLKSTSTPIEWETHAEAIKLAFGEHHLQDTTTLHPFLKEKMETNASNVFTLFEYLDINHSLANKNDLAIAAIILDAFFPALVAKKITQQTLVDAYSYLAVTTRTIALSTISKNNQYIQDLMRREHWSHLENSFTETAFRTLFNRPPSAEQLREFATLIGVTLTNGPGTISAKGAKESVSAKNNITTAFIGYLANTGLAHGGNGFEGIGYLLRSFDDFDMKYPGLEKFDFSPKEVATKAAKAYASYKKTAKSKGKDYDKIPGINHPVFKDKKINIDPREVYIYEQFKSSGIHNVFWDFYRELVLALKTLKVTKNVYCVNIDGVIAAITLKLLWTSYSSGSIDHSDMRKIAFNIFLFGRTAGIAAEIDDHRNRGTDMDCRTPASEVKVVV